MNEWLETRRRVFSTWEEYGKIIFVVVTLFICFVFGYRITSQITPSELRVSFLDVGQGDAIFVQTPSGKSMLIDGGPSNIIVEKMAQEMSYFNHIIDVMLVTHPDADHVTGLIPVLEKYKIGTVVVSPREGDTNIFNDLTLHIHNEHAGVYVAHRGDVIDFHDGAVAEILYPDSHYLEKKKDTNDASVSLLLTYGNESFLLTGDLPLVEEGKLLSEKLPHHITVYKAGHHGSKYSSGEQLLSYIKPEYVVVSAGKNNRYGHPNLEALSRLQKYSQEIISTIDRGTITFVTDGHLMKLEMSK